jgi:hypothetical protein
MKDKKIKTMLAMINTIDGFKGDGFSYLECKVCPFQWYRK